MKNKRIVKAWELFIFILSMFICTIGFTYLSRTEFIIERNFDIVFLVLGGICLLLLWLAVSKWNKLPNIRKILYRNLNPMNFIHADAK